MKKIITFSLLMLVFTGCKINVINNVKVDAAVAFEILKQDAYGGRDKESTVIIKTQAELDKLYKELGWSSVPKIDFIQNNVVALFMGEKSTGGYSIGVRKVSVVDGTVVVNVLKTSPEGMATMAITAPYCIVAVPKSDKTVIE
ncbi:protease complex subunit PrcB family protein [Flavobacterium cerinum]|uniref:Protease complex subunit PrcB family protein n=1 Tax=Flavobacterium cerinum TaxID=2502784 RepID=A0A3S3QLS3_9FLAO|nr:protease complex subunit PrcB family protein [Flavobacterium cerinum]RWX01457.1 protease complex subunit PrcB family protein [Flavobacterium cerinum]